MSDITYRLAQKRNIVTELPGPRSAELATRRRAAVAGGVTSSAPVYAADADGGVIVDVDGNSLIDLGSGIAVTSVGASHPAVAAAVAQQAARFTHTCFMITPYEGYVELAERLNALTPGDHEKRTAFFNSGSEAVENAVKVARLATGRQAVVAFDHAYHGRTNMTMALTAKAMPYKSQFGPFAPEIYRMPASYPYRDGLTGEAAAQAAISRIETQIGAASVAAVIIEPIQGEGGFIVPAPGFLPTIVDWCKSNGVVFIADEVQTGFARTGAWFASEHEGIVPDIVTMAKGIAGGMPLAAITGRADLLDAVHPGGLGGTYGGNPVACAAALATLDAMTQMDLPGRARAIEATVVPQLRALSDTGVIGDIRGRGGMLAIEIVKPDTGNPGAPDPVLTKAIAAEAFNRGVLILTCGTYGNVIRLLPPLVISDELLDEGISLLADIVREQVAK